MARNSKAAQGLPASSASTVYPLERDVDLDGFHQHDLNRGVPGSRASKDFDYMLMLDVIEHLSCSGAIHAINCARQ